MPKGMPKVMKIHEKSTLGRPWVDFLTPWSDFGGCRKIVDFLIALGAAKKLEKWSQGAAKGRQGDFGNSLAQPRRRQGVQGSLARYSF